MTIVAPILAEIHRQLEAGYPLESCGVMLGRDGVVCEIVPVPNAEIDSGHNRYLIEPREYSRIERDADQRGWQVLGIYHSHPDAAARPSGADLANAWPELSYLIVTVARGKVVESLCWRLDEAQRTFAAEAIECV